MLSDDVIKKIFTLLLYHLPCFIIWHS